MEKSREQVEEELKELKAENAELRAELQTQDRQGLSQRNQILALVANAAEQFLLHDEVDEGINGFLRDLGATSDACRIYVFEKHLDDSQQEVVSLRFVWNREGVQPELRPPDLQALPLDAPRMLGVTARLRKGDVVHGPVRNFEEAAQEMFISKEVQSVLMVPVMVENAWWGFVGFDACRKEISWADLEIDTLRVAASLIGTTLCRKRVRVELQEAEEKLRRRGRDFMSMAENSPDIIMRFDREHRHLYVNPAVQTVVPAPPEAFIGKTHAEMAFPAPTVEYWETALAQTFETGEAFHGEFNLITPDSQYVIQARLIPEFNQEGEVETVLAVSHNITPMKKVELELMERQQEYLRTAAELAQSREQLRRLRRHAEKVREEEQRKIAKRIHDDFGQRLTTLSMDVAWIRNTVCEPGSEAYRRASADLGLIESLLKLARDVSMELRPAVLDHFGLPAALIWAAENFQASSKVPVELDVDESIRLEREAESGLFQIVQELLTNVARHAEATEVSLSLAWNMDKVQITVSDNGVGMSDQLARRPNSMGLLAARETALSLGGTFDVLTQLGQGSTFYVALPDSVSDGVQL